MISLQKEEWLQKEISHLTLFGFLSLSLSISLEPYRIREVAEMVRLRILADGSCNLNKRKKIKKHRRAQGFIQMRLRTEETD